MVKHRFEPGDEVRTSDGFLALITSDMSFDELAEIGPARETGYEPGHEYAALVRECDGTHAVRDVRTLEPTGRRFDEQELWLAEMLDQVPDMIEALTGERPVCEAA